MKRVLFRIVVAAEDVQLRNEVEVNIVLVLLLCLYLITQAHAFALQVCHEDLQVTAAGFFRIDSYTILAVRIVSKVF